MSPASIYDFIHANVCTTPVQRERFFEEDRKVMSVSYIYVVVAGGWVTAGQEYLDETGNWEDMCGEVLQGCSGFIEVEKLRREKRKSSCVHGWQKRK